MARTPQVALLRALIYCKYIMRGEKRQKQSSFPSEDSHPPPPPGQLSWQNPLQRPANERPPPYRTRRDALQLSREFGSDRSDGAGASRPAPPRVQRARWLLWCREGLAWMALPAPPPARVFAELCPVPAPASVPAPVPAGGGGGLPAPSGREVHVSGSAELSAVPDRARVSLRLGSRKGVAGAARSSVSRRLEYIAQSARQRGVPVSGGPEPGVSPRDTSARCRGAGCPAGRVLGVVKA